MCTHSPGHACVLRLRLESTLVFVLVQVVKLTHPSRGVKIANVLVWAQIRGRG